MKRSIFFAGLLLMTQSLVAQSYGDYSVLVDVTGNGYSHYTTIYFDDESWDPQNPPTYGWDGCCDALLSLGNAYQPHVFTEVVAPPAPANNHRLSINGLPHLFEPIDVPMGFLPGELASYVFTFKELYTLPVGVTVELEDLALNVTQDLLVDSTYDTWAAVSDDEARFIVHFYPGNVTGTDKPEPFGSTILVRTEIDRFVISGISGNGQAELRLFDMLGNLVMKSDLGQVDGQIAIVQRPVLPKGIYILEVTTEVGERKTVKLSY